ncbi:MAG: hypothetical protein RI949_345 [Pseudomonadota bacterium]|jgi:hypothetical protein
MLLLVSTIKLIAEIALMAFLGQALLALLAGQKRNQNFFYRLLQVLTSPFVRAARFITPRLVIDRHVPIAAFVMLLSIWVVATISKISICVQMGVAQCR